MAIGTPMMMATHGIELMRPLPQAPNVLTGTDMLKLQNYLMVVHWGKTLSQTVRSIQK